jgi:hypothetical protein
MFDHLVSAVWSGKTLATPHWQAGFLCAQERKLTLSVSSVERIRPMTTTFEAAARGNRLVGGRGWA